MFSLVIFEFTQFGLVFFLGDFSFPDFFIVFFDFLFYLDFAIHPRADKFVFANLPIMGLFHLIK